MNLSIHVVRNYLGVVIGVFLDAAIADGFEADANLQLVISEETPDGVSHDATIPRLFHGILTAGDYEQIGYVALTNGRPSDIRSTAADALGVGTTRQFK